MIRMVTKESSKTVNTTMSVIFAVSLVVALAFGFVLIYNALIGSFLPDLPATLGIDLESLGITFGITLEAMVFFLIIAGISGIWIYMR